MANEEFEQKVALIRDGYIHAAIEDALAERSIPIGAMILAQFGTVFASCFLPA